MTKNDAKQLFGGTCEKLADALGIKRQNISYWNDELSTKQIDRVLGACIRLNVKIPQRYFDS